MPVPLAEQMYRYIMGQGSGFTGLLDTYTGAAAAYSVRKLSSTYSGSALRVRRSSDDTEQDIGFDANGDLDTTALTTFVNADVNQYTSDFSSTEDLSEFNGTGAAAQSVGGVDDAYKFTLSGGSGNHFAYRNIHEVGQSHEVSFDVYIPSSNSAVDGVLFSLFGAQDIVSTSTTDEWVTLTATYSANYANGNFFATDGGSKTVNGDGDVFYLKNIVVTQTTADGAVTKWYDQSGNNHDAINADASEQPLVVSGGSVVTENGKAAIDFDATDDFLQIPFAAGVTDNWFVAGVQKPNNLTGIKYSYGARDTSGDGPVVFANNDTLNARVAGTTIQANPMGSDRFLYIQELSATNNTHKLYLNGILADSEAASSINTTTNIRIGRSAYVDSGVLDGLLQELIFFNSDQSTNRTGIETNINDYFSIYEP